MSANPRRALVVIDVQNEYVSGDLPIEYPPIETSLANIARAMDAARAAGVPVVVVQNFAPAGSPIFARGSVGAELHPVVASRERDHYVEKSLPSAFAGNDLKAWLAEGGIDTITVAGYMTHNCNDTTIKHAFDRGLAVEFVHDASGAVSYANHAGYASAEEIHRVFSVVEQSRFAAVLSTEEWLHALATGEAPVRDNVLDSYRAAQALRRSAA